MKLEDFGMNQETNTTRSYYGLYTITTDFINYITDMYGISDTWEKQALHNSLLSVFYDPKADECIVCTKDANDGFRVIKCNADTLDAVSHMTGMPSREQLEMANEAVKKMLKG